MRSTTELTVNPAARYVRPLDDKDLARMIGFDPKKNRAYLHRGREAFEQLHADGVIDLRKDDGGWRIFGPGGEVLSSG